MSQGRRIIKKQKPVTIPAEAVAALAEIPDRRIGALRHAFTRLQDDMIYYGYAVKGHDALAEAVGCGDDTLRRRYKELVKERGAP